MLCGTLDPLRLLILEERLCFLTDICNLGIPTIELSPHLSIDNCRVLKRQIKKTKTGGSGLRFCDSMRRWLEIIQQYNGGE